MVLQTSKCQRRRRACTFSVLVITIVVGTFCPKLLLGNVNDTGTEPNLVFDHISVAEGLSQSTVYAICQDSKGLMWFGTRTGGLNRYDGNVFKTYKNNSDDPFSISGNEILDIFEDRKGRLWIATRNFGINRFDYNTERFYHYLHVKVPKGSSGYRKVHAITEDSKGQIWIATQGGVCIYNEADDEFDVCIKENDKSYSGSVAIVAINDTTIGVGSMYGLFLINSNTRKLIKEFKHWPNNPNSINTNNVSALLLDSRDRLWVGTKGRGINLLNNFSSNEFTHFVNDINISASLTNNTIRFIEEDKDGTIWIGTPSGLEELRVQEQNKIFPKFIHHKYNANNSKSLAENDLFAFHQDVWGNYWLGTWSKGVSYSNQYAKKFKHIKNNSDINISLGDDYVTCFTENESGIWVGTGNSGVALYNAKTNMFIRNITKDDENPIIPDNRIRSLFTDADGSVWIGTNKGLMQYFPETGVSNLIFEFRINYIAKGIDDELWFGGEKSLIKFHKSTGQSEEYKRVSNDTNSLSGSSISAIYLDKNNDLWIGTTFGLNKYDRKNDRFIRYMYSPVDNKSLSSDKVVAITNDLNGNLWIGTYDGLNKFNPNTKTFTRYSENKGLPDNVINGILVDNSNKLWLSSNKGLITLSLKDTDSNNNPIIRHYTIEDGLQGNEFNRRSQYKTKDGSFMFGGLQGFNIFQPDSIKDNPQIPDVILTDLLLNHKVVKTSDESNLLDNPISLTDKIVFNHKQSVIGFRFTALSYMSSQKNQYAYIMEGFDEDWNYIGSSNQANYTNLPAGRYVFKAKASNNDGLWNEVGTSIDIRVLAPWYKTKLFFALMVLLIGATIVVLIRNREKQQKADKKRLEDELAEGKERIRKQQAQVDEQARNLQIKEENEKAVKWYNKGYIKLTNIINSNRDNLDKLANKIIFDLVSYLNAYMGVIYFENDNVLEIKGGYALDEQRINNRTVQSGEGLVGCCYRDKKITHVDNLPTNYANLNSGLGEAKLSNLVLIPIMYNDGVEGVIEILTNKRIEGDKINLIKDVCSVLGATLQSEKSHLRIAELQKENQQYQSNLSANNEELRQNLEELTATQEESARREEKLIKQIEELKAFQEEGAGK